MRILFVNQYYWPDVASTGQHLTDLAEHLARAGHEVRVVCSRGGYLDGEARAPRRETRHGVEIRRVGGLGRGQRRRVAWRVFDYAAFHLSAGYRTALSGWADSVVTLTTPPLLGVWGRLAQLLRGTRHVVWSMDLHPDAEFALGMLEERSLLGRLLERAHAAPLRRADAVVALGPHMTARIERKGVDRGRICEIPVWSRAEEVVELSHADNSVRARRGWQDRFVVLYSGNAGLLHRFDELLDGAELLARREPRVLFAFVGGGPRRAELERAAVQRGLRNMEFLDYVPREQLGPSLASGDAHFLSLAPEHAGIAVPGKLYGALASGRPVLFVGAAACESAETIRQAGCGVALEPGHGAELADAIARLATDPEHTAELGRRARAAFEARFERAITCEAWRELLEGLTPTDAQPRLASAA